MNVVSVILFAVMGVVFHELFFRLSVMPDVRRVFRVAPEAVSIMRSAALSDDEKEQQIRQMSIDVLKTTLRFSAKLIVMLLVVVGIAALVQWSLRPSSEGLVALLTSWQALLVVVIVVPLYARWRHG